MIKRTILVACIAVLAFAALPALAAAEEVTSNPSNPYLEGIKEGTKFTIAGGEIKWTGSAATFKCKKYSGSGEFYDPETGSLTLTFEECNGPFNAVCTTPGQKSGVITTTTLPFHLKTLEHGVVKPGVLITPGPEEVSQGKHFETFECPIVGKVIIGGNGLIGALTKPEEGVASNTLTLSFSSTEPGSTTQTHRKVTNDETEYDLKTSIPGIGGGETSTTAEDAESVITFAEEMKPTLKTTPPPC